MKQTRIDVPQCPEGHGDTVFEKKWKTVGDAGKGFITELYRCPICNKTVRRTKPLKENKNDDEDNEPDN